MDPLLDSRPKVRNANSGGGFGNHNLSGTYEQTAEANIQVLACGARQAYDALDIELHDLPDRHEPPVQFHVHFDRDVNELADLFEGSHCLFDQLERILHDFIRSRDYAGVCLVAALIDQQVRELSGDVDG